MPLWYKRPTTTTTATTTATATAKHSGECRQTLQYLIYHLNDI